jgi:adenylate cyclase
VPLSKSLGASRTVALLNEMMRRFDALAAKHGVEKIKTIGDAYMAVAGLPEPVADHADRLARMGLEMFAAKDEVAAHFGVMFRMRIGIASGPVMAGIIGTRKFSYDVWGDAVNLAARLESSGEPERIQVSADARAAMSGWCDFESRGLIEIKGLGRLETWFLVPHGAKSGTA